MGISNNGINCNSSYNQQSYVRSDNSSRLKHSAAMYSNANPSNGALSYLIGDQDSNTQTQSTQPKKRDALSFLGLKPGDILKNVLAIQSTKSTNPVTQPEAESTATNTNQGFLSLTMSGKAQN